MMFFVYKKKDEFGNKLSINITLHVVFSITLSHMMYFLILLQTDLAQNRYFEDEAFIGYLKYLKYWQRPEYIKFIMWVKLKSDMMITINSSFCTQMVIFFKDDYTRNIYLFGVTNWCLVLITGILIASSFLSFSKMLTFGMQWHILVAR